MVIAETENGTEQTQKIWPEIRPGFSLRLQNALYEEFFNNVFLFNNTN